MTTDNYPRRHHRREEEPAPDKTLKARNVLNIIFMLGAIVGVIIYLWVDHNAGVITVLAAMVFKIVECCIRFIR